MKKILKKVLVVFAFGMLYYPSIALCEGADTTLLLDTSVVNYAKISPEICTEIAVIEARYNVICSDTTCIPCTTDLSVGWSQTEDGMAVLLIYCGKDIMKKIECIGKAQIVCSDSIASMEQTIAGNSCCPLPQNIIDIKEQLATEKYFRSRINFIMNYLNAKLKYIDILLD